MLPNAESLDDMVAGVVPAWTESSTPLASMVGPLLAGLSRDRFGSYAPRMFTGVAVPIISGLLIFTLPRCPALGEPIAARLEVGSSSRAQLAA